MLAARVRDVPEDDRSADADHRRQPHRLRLADKQDTHAAHGEPLGEDEIKYVEEASTAGPRTRSSSCPTACTSTSSRASARAARAARAAWDDDVRGVRRSSRSSPTSSTRMQKRELPDGWDKDLPTFPADAEGPRGPRRVGARCSTRSRRTYPWLIGGSADLAPSTKTRLTFEGAGDFERDTDARPQLPLRRPRARDGRGAQRHGAVEAARRTARGSSSSATTRGRRSGCRRSWRSRSSTSSRTTRSASAKTARRTSRSSTSRRCARCRG